MLCVLGDPVEVNAVTRPQRVAFAAATNVSIELRRGGSAADVALATARMAQQVRFTASIRPLVGPCIVQGTSLRVDEGGPRR